MRWDADDVAALAYRDAGILDPGHYEGMSIDEVADSLRDFASRAGSERLSVYLGRALAMTPEGACHDDLVEAYVESRLATVRGLRALRESFAKPPRETA